MSDSELLSRIEVSERLRKRGYERRVCPDCKGLGVRPHAKSKLPVDCTHCDGKGGTWMPPMER